MNAFLKFNKGLMRIPLPWRMWLMVLVAVNLLAPLFYLGRTEARVVLAVFLAGAMLMTILTALSGFSRLLGLGHILWIPLLIWLWARLGQVPAEDFYGVWLRALMAINLASLAIDAVDVVRYIRGERGETIKGLG